MISMAQARALVASCSYRNWEISVPNPDRMTVGDLMITAMAEARSQCIVTVTYTAEDSDPDNKGNKVTNKVNVFVPLPDTEAEFARALYEVIAGIEEHERREFFRCGYGLIDHKVIEKRSPALFHPHGVKRNELFHDLDPYARDLRLEAADGSPFTADAV